MKGRRGRGRGHRRGRGAGVRRAGPPAAAACTAPREGKGRLPSKANSPLRSRPDPGLPPTHPAGAEPRGLGAGSASPAAGQRLPSAEGKGELFSLGGVEEGGRRKIHILLRP